MVYKVHSLLVSPLSTYPSLISTRLKIFAGTITVDAQLTLLIMCKIDSEGGYVRRNTCDLTFNLTALA